MGSIAACIEAASAKSETSKCAFVDEGVHVLLIDAMHQPGTSDDALRPICGALRSFATADDLRPTTSRYIAQHAASMCAHLKSCVGKLDVHCCISQLFCVAHVADHMPAVDGYIVGCKAQCPPSGGMKVRPVLFSCHL